MESFQPRRCAQCQTLDLYAIFNRPGIPDNGTHVTTIGKASKASKHPRTSKMVSCELCEFFHSLAPAYIRRHELHVRLFDHIYRCSLREPRVMEPASKKPFLTVVRKNSRLRYDQDIEDEVVQNGLCVFVAERDLNDASVARVGLEVDFSSVGAQLRRCIDKHERCGQTAQTMAELTHISLIDCEALLIVESSIDEQYLALSYVWGRQTMSHMRNKKVNSRLNEAPLTVRDAMSAVQRLGYRYLWVDRFCIDQDDTLARATTIANMDLIYERSIATIVALHGDNDQAGLPGVSTTLRLPQMRIECNSGFLLSSGPPVGVAIERSKWSTRGWTYQEARLSRRCLFFSSTQLYFVCRESTWSEAVPFVPSSNSITTLLNSARLDGALFRRRNAGQAISCDRLMYTRRDLTFPGDALNAFRGILRRSQWFTFWGVPVNLKEGCANSDDCFALGLLWIKRPGWMRSAHLRMPTTPLVRRQGFPTWSWTSLATEIHQDGYGIPSLYGQYIQGVAVNLPYNEAQIEFSVEVDNTFRPLTDLMHRLESEFPPETSKRLLIKGYTVSLKCLQQDEYTWYNVAGKWLYFRADLQSEEVNPGKPDLNATEDSEDALILIQWVDANKAGKTRFVLMLLNWVDDYRAERKGLLTEYRGEFNNERVISLPRTYKEFILL